MSNKQISFKHKVQGVLTDATSVVLRDATNTYGLRRVDTSAVIVASGTAFGHDGAGLYSTSFTGLVGGVNYQYAVEWVYAGETKREVRTFAAAADAPMSSQPYQVIGILSTRNPDGSIRCNAAVQFQMSGLPLAQSGSIYDDAIFSLTSDDAGRIAYPFVQGAKYQYRNAAGTWIPFTAPVSGTGFDIPDGLGKFAG
jgi:hypothetical protein